MSEIMNFHIGFSFFFFSIFKHVYCEIKRFADYSYNVSSADSQLRMTNLLTQSVCALLSIRDISRYPKNVRVQ